MLDEAMEDGIWDKDPVRKNKHRELTRAGMERARQEGKLIGVLPVERREGFAEKFALVLVQLERKAITRRQAAEELGISGPTLKRVLDDYLAATRRTLIADEERVALVV
jgi:DNA invertase Pin-like site-specific DNA recombinase